MDIYAQCQHCGNEFAVSNMIVSGGAENFSVNLGGNLVTCPRCRQPARVMDGRFVGSGDESVMLDGPEWSRALLERMAGQLAEIESVAESAALSDDEARAKVEAILSAIAESNPEVAAQYRRLEEPADRRSWIVAAKSVAVNILAGVGAIESVSALSERIYQTWRDLTGG